MFYLKKIWLFAVVLFINSASLATDYGGMEEFVKYESGTLSIIDLTTQTYELGKEQYEEKEFELALKTFLLVESYADKANLPEILIDTYYYLGRSYKQLDNYQRALEYFYKILEEDKLPYFKDISRINSAIAAIYLSLGDYEKSYDYQHKALIDMEAKGDSLRINKALYQLGSIFFYQNRYREALVYYEKAKVFCEKTNNKIGLYSCLAAIGSCYDNAGESEKSLLHNSQSLILAEELNYTTGVAYALHNVASNYFKQSKYELALDCLEQALKIKKEINDKSGQIGTLELLAQVYGELNQVPIALKLIEEALVIAKEIEAKPKLQSLYKSYAKLYELKGDYDNAYQYLQAYTNLKDTLLNEKSLEEMSDRKYLYETQKKEKQIELLQKDQKIGTLYKYIFGGSTIFLALLVGGIFYRYRMQQKTNALLAEKNQEIAQQYEALEEANLKQLEISRLLAEKNNELNDSHNKIKEQNEQLEESNESLNQFASVASHDLKEPLRMIGSYTKLIQRRYTSQLDDTAQEFMGYITDATTRMEALLNDLLAYSRVGTQAAPSEEVNLQNTFTIVTANLYQQLKEINATVEVDENMPSIVGSNTQMIQLFQNLISNAVKFRDERIPKVIVTCEHKSENYLIKVQDNGIGIAPEYQDKIFDMFRRLHTRDEYEGTGIGLATCYKIVQRHGGKIWVESEVGVGSTFFITLPIQVGVLVAA